MDQSYRDRIHAHQLRAYFYGTPIYLPKGMNESDLGNEVAIVDTTLAPYSSVVSFDDLVVYRVGGGM